MVRSIKEAEQNRIVMEATDGSGLELRPVQVVEIRAFMGEWPRLLRIRQSGNQAIRQSGNQAIRQSGHYWDHLAELKAIEKAMGSVITAAVACRLRLGP